MDITLIFKVVGAGLIVAVSSQILSKYGRDEQSIMVIISGIVAVLLMLVSEIGVLFDNIADIFGL